jgi:hypothetical protein
VAQWYFCRQGEVRGPFTTEQLREYAAVGRVLQVDLVCREGQTKWVPAGGVSELWPAAPQPARLPPPLPAGSAAAVPAGVPRAGGENRSWLARWLLILPKPVLFGLAGGVGGLAGAVVLAELFWQVLSPAGVRALEPQLQLAVPASLQVYAGGRNTCVVSISRHRCKGPVRIEAAPAPGDGITVSDAEIRSEEQQAEIEVAVPRGIAAGAVPVTLRASSIGEPGIAPITRQLDLIVVPRPPTLAVTISPRLTVFQGGTGRFTVRASRARFDGDVMLRFSGMPEGVDLSETVLHPGKSDATIEFKTAPACPVGNYAVNVEASSRADGTTLSGTALMKLSIEKAVTPAVDVLFVLDLTGSMQFAINGIKQGIRSFVEQLEGTNVDARIGLIGFRDIQADKERPFVLLFEGEPFTRDYGALRDKLKELFANGGGDEPESSLQALALAAQQPFRGNASRVLVLITDAPPKIHPDEQPSTVAQTVEELKNHEIDQVHYIARRRDVEGPYAPLKSEFSGDFFDIQRASRGDAFAGLLPGLSKAISRITTAAVPRALAVYEPPPLPEERAARLDPPPTQTAVVKAVQSTQAFAATDLPRLFLATVVWTMLLGGSISLFVLAGQQLHSRGTRVDLPRGLRAFGGGLLAGLVGGAVGQLVFQSTAGRAGAEPFSRILGWSCFGALSGGVLALFVPNLKAVRGMLGGLVGGFLGALAFLLVNLLVGSLASRWIGAGVLGLFIGMMVALAEVAFRRFWLEIAVSPREVRTMTLGTAPVSVGGDERQASFFVAGAAPVALRYWIAGDKILCEDVPARQTVEVQPGSRRALGRVAVTVCSSTGNRPIGLLLRLDDGRVLPLQDGMPLIATDLPGLEPQGSDGLVALVSRHPSRPGDVLLRNRSRQRWTAARAGAGNQAVEPGKGIELAPGLRLEFGRIGATVGSDSK